MLGPIAMLEDSKVSDDFSFAIPTLELTLGRYILRFVQNAEDLDKVLKLRFEIFNLELQIGLKSSYETGRDQDRFDQYFHHLMVIDAKSSELVGTYRMQTYEMAQKHLGFYSAQEFDFSTFPQDILEQSIELGRACIAKGHRKGRALALLWMGVARYLLAHDKRYLFGCCSLNGCDIDEGYQVWCDLKKLGAISDRCEVKPALGHECFPEDYSLDEPRFVQIPYLLQIYINYYAYMCGPPAIDRDCGTIDFLTLTDIKDLEVDPKLYDFFTKG